MVSLDFFSLTAFSPAMVLVVLSAILCLSFTAGGLLVVFRFRQTRRSEHFHLLQYFLILLYVYGYYSLWSAIALAGFMEMENVERVAALVAQMGAPFFLVALLMLVLWTARIHERAAAPLLGFAAAASVLLMAAALQWAPGTDDPVRALCSVAAFVASMLLATALLAGGKAPARPVVRPEGRRWLLALTVATGLIHLTALTPLHTLAHFEALFVLAFYLFNTALVVVYAYQAPEALMQPQLSLEDFLLKYGISRREADILRGIYAGKTNQEIASALFISLQTVKDHSSRIYQKTFVKNRAQLSTLIRESQTLEKTPLLQKSD